MSVCVVNFHVAIFGNQRIRVLEKKVNETQVSKTVFGHLDISVSDFILLFKRGGLYAIILLSDLFLS